MIKKMWLSKEILNWTSFSGGEIVDRQLYERAYEIWEHSHTIVENAINDLQLSDGIMNLKRCLNQRLQLIEKLYGFKSINIEDRPNSKDYLELLQKYGIVRPTIMKTLMNIRNGIEHRDEIPPSLERCKEFVDIIWYFLKSTDSIVRIKSESADFEYYDLDGKLTQYFCAVKLYDENKISLKINGWFPTEFVFNDYRENAFEIIVDEVNTKARWENTKALSEVSLDILSHDDKLETDLWLTGEIKLKQKDITVIINKVINS